MVIDVRLKNVKGAKEKIEASSYIILNPKENKGNWNTVFPKKQKIQIEIGMGKGNFIIENARRYPEINFIGIEKFDSVIVRAIEKLEKLEEELPNLKLIRMDALEIDEVFDHEVDTIYLNFSDPWPKKRHQNRRLSSPVFLKKYDTLFTSDKKIVMKTDNRHLFEYSVMSIANYGYQLEELSFDLYQDNVKDNIPTEYEERFANKGFNIYRMVATKKD